MTDFVKCLHATRVLLIKANMWAISRDTHQLDYIPKHNFIV